MHKQKGKYFLVGGMGQGKKRKHFSAGGMEQQKFFFWLLHRGSRNLMVSGYILWSGHPVLT
jgi:cytochrome b subunit of formate dehydrogenase